MIQSTNVLDVLRKALINVEVNDKGEIVNKGTEGSYRFEITESYEPGKSSITLGLRAIPGPYPLVISTEEPDTTTRMSQEGFVETVLSDAINYLVLLHKAMTTGGQIAIVKDGTVIYPENLAVNTKTTL